MRRWAGRGLPPADVGRRRPERRLGPEPVRQTPVAAPRAVPGACAGRSGQVPLPRSRVEGVLPGMGPRPPLPAVRVGRRSARRGRRVRENESPERAFGGPRGPPGGAGGGRASTSGGPWQGGWGRRGVSVSLGRGSASGGCPEKARLGSPGVGPSAPRSGPQAASSVRRARWPAGPSPEAGYEFQSVGAR